MNVIMARAWMLWSSTQSNMNLSMVLTYLGHGHCGHRMQSDMNVINWVGHEYFRHRMQSNIPMRGGPHPHNQDEVLEVLRGPEI